MPTTMSNQATATYTFAGSTEELTEISNENQVILRNETGISITKTSDTNTFLPGQTITYYVSITNTGSLYFTGVRITDDLTGTGYLTYVPNSARLFINGQWLAAEVVSTNPLVATLSPLSPSGSYLLMYQATVSSSIPATVDTLSNSVEGIGYTWNSTVTGNSTYTLTRSTSGDLTIIKTSSESTVSVGQVFNYTLTLSNTSDTIATLSSLEDQLPEGFTITSISMRIGSGSTTTLASTDYTVDSTNLLTIPSSTGPVLTVPANGTSVITIYGYFTSTT